MSIYGRNLRRVLFLVFGLMLDGIGASLIVYSNLGSDPFNVLAQGLSGLLRLHLGTICMLMQFAILAAVLITARRRVSVGTIAGIFLVGSVINFWSALFAPWLSTAGTGIRLACMAAAPAVTGMGIAMIQIAELGMLPNDIVPLLIYEKFRQYQYRTVRIAYDLTLFFIGTALGGTIGAGTVVAAFLTGPCIQMSLKFLKRFQIQTSTSGAQALRRGGYPGRLFPPHIVTEAAYIYNNAHTFIHEIVHAKLQNMG